MTKNFQAQKDKPQDPGFSLPVAIITGFIILIGSLALTSRSSWGVFGSIFLNQSDEARDAAETGMSRFIAELNLERNRWLLVLRNSRAANENDPDTGIWQNRSTSAKIVELRQNPCLIGTTTSPSIEKPRYSVLDPNDAASTQYKKWFILSDGTITAGSNGVTPANAVKSYRLAGITRQTYATDNKELQKLMSVWRDRTQNPSGVGKVTIQVEGQSYRSGTIIASVILEKELELTPKCCKMPFGEAHGNTDYYDETTRTSVCLNLGLGLLGGAAGTNTGSIIVKGRSTDLEDENGSPVNTIYCLTSNTAGCAIDVKDPDINVSIIDPKLPAAFTFCDKAPSSSCPSGTAPSPGTFTAKDITSTSATDFASVVKKTSSPSGNGLERDTVIINPNATTNIPSYCSASADTMHCNIAVFNYQLRDVIFKTGTKKLMFFFPSSGTVMSQSGNETVKHCSSYSVSATSPAACGTTRDNGDALSITDLTFFGSNTALSPQQVVQLQGTTDAPLKFFMYMPTASVSLYGNATFEGILWTDDINSTGNPTWIVPGTGLAAVYQLMDMKDPTTNGVESLFFDFTLRATNQQRWRGG